MARIELLLVVALVDDVPALGLVRSQVGTVVEIFEPGYLRAISVMIRGTAMLPLRFGVSR